MGKAWDPDLMRIKVCSRDNQVHWGHKTTLLDQLTCQPLCLSQNCIAHNHLGTVMLLREGLDKMHLRAMVVLNQLIWKLAIHSLGTAHRGLHMVGKTVMHLYRTPSCYQRQCLYPRLLYIIHSHLVPDFSHCIIKETPHHCIISCHTHSPMMIGWHGQEMLHNNPFSLEVSLRMVLSMRRKWCSSIRGLQRCMTGRQILGCPQAVQKVLHQSRGESAGASWDSRLILGMNPVNLQVAGKRIMSGRWDTRKRREVDVSLEGRGMKTLTAAVRIVLPTVTERRPAGWVTVAPHFPNCKPLMAGIRTGSLSSSSLITWLAAVDGVR